MVLNILQRLLPLLFELFYHISPFPYAFFVSPLVQLIVLLHLPSPLLVLREHSHDLLLDRVLLLQFAPYRDSQTLGSASGFIPLLINR